MSALAVSVDAFQRPISYANEPYEISLNKIQENGRVWIALASSAVRDIQI